MVRIYGQAARSPACVLVTVASADLPHVHGIDLKHGLEPVLSVGTRLAIEPIRAPRGAARVEPMITVGSLTRRNGGFTAVDNVLSPPGRPRDRFPRSERCWKVHRDARHGWSDRPGIRLRAGGGLGPCPGGRPEFRRHHLLSALGAPQCFARRPARGAAAELRRL